MTDNETIKALEEYLQKCQNIKYGARQVVLVNSDFLQNILDLINRQKAEIEILNEIVYTDRTEAIKKIKSEAIKEFAERLAQHFSFSNSEEEVLQNLIIRNAIDEVLKEMTEQDND